MIVTGSCASFNKLPQPWDLPVIFAVRISMSLPALFQAVRLYRIRRPSPIQDDFGRTLIDHGQPLTLLSPLDSAQELWFSDGGITSNFPVHFFDDALPRWPTVSLNLGIHPHEAPHQDIWLPQDWDDLNIPVKTLGDSGPRVRQSDLRYRDVVARQPAIGAAGLSQPDRSGSDESRGGWHESVHAAGDHRLHGSARRLCRRTAAYPVHSDDQWDRFRWLRLRTAVSNIEKLRANTHERRGFYDDAFSAEEWLDKQVDFSDKPSPGRSLVSAISGILAESRPAAEHFR